MNHSTFDSVHTSRLQCTPVSKLFFIEFRQKRTLKSQIKFNFSAAENSANQSYCSLCVPRDQNNSRFVRMIPSSGKPAFRIHQSQNPAQKRSPLPQTINIIFFKFLFIFFYFYFFFYRSGQFSFVFVCHWTGKICGSLV